MDTLLAIFSDVYFCVLHKWAMKLTYEIYLVSVHTYLVMNHRIFHDLDMDKNIALSPQI